MRQAVVDAAWFKFDIYNAGIITIEEIKAKGLNAKSNLDFQSGRKTEEAIINEFIGAFGDKYGDGAIYYEDWYDYYIDISSGFDNSENFVKSIQDTWTF
jgi:hypothetical protein